MFGSCFRTLAVILVLDLFSVCVCGGGGGGGGRLGGLNKPRIVENKVQNFINIMLMQLQVCF